MGFSTNIKLEKEDVVMSFWPTIENGHKLRQSQLLKDHFHATGPRWGWLICLFYFTLSFQINLKMVQTHPLIKLLSVELNNQVIGFFFSFSFFAFWRIWGIVSNECFYTRIWFGSENNSYIPVFNIKIWNIMSNLFCTYRIQWKLDISDITQYLIRLI